MFEINLSNRLIGRISGLVRANLRMYSLSLSFTYYSQRLDIGAAFAFAAAAVVAGFVAAVADDAGVDDDDG